MREILSDYNKARESLRDNGKDGWRRDQETGRYYLWKAYHQIKKSAQKDPLLYARILSLMASESRFPTTDYERLQLYIKPAYEAYQEAIAAGLKPSDKELEENRISSETLTYQFECENLPWDEQIKWINGYEKLDQFSFHDSKPIRFEQTDESARLTLQYGDIQVTFLFDGIFDYRAEGDPRTNWISEFYCYPCYHNKNLLTFDVEYFKITCEKISVAEVTKITK